MVLKVNGNFDKLGGYDFTTLTDIHLPPNTNGVRSIKSPAIFVIAE